MRNHFIYLLLICLFLNLNVSEKSVAQTIDSTVRITEIRVEGNRRVSIGTVESYLPIRVGDLTSQSALSNALKQLYKTNLFSNVSLEMDGSVLVVKLAENPIINRVNIEGNDVLTDEKLLDLIDIEPRRIYNRRVALDARRKLLDIYRQSGRYAAVIEPKIINLKENRVDLVFEVDEGPLIKIRNIVFNGNKAFSDRVLRAVIASQETKWWAFLAANDKYDEGRLDYDLRLLRQFYKSRGYADIKVNRVRGGLLPDRSGFVVTFFVDEGVRYKVGGVAVTSEIEGVDVNKLATFLSFEDEGWYDVRALEQGLLDITRELGSLGYAFVNVVPEIDTDSESGELSIVIKIGKATRNFVERIEFVDNSRTLDSVIRREFEIVEGDAFDQLKIERSIRNVRNLGFFSDVTVQTIQGSAAEQSIVKVRVAEQSTGSFAIGVGYSSFDKASFTVGVNELNFLGTGRRADASISSSSTSTYFNFGISEPYLFGRNLMGSFDVFNQQTENSGTKVKRLGSKFGFGFAAANNVYHRLNYELSQSLSSSSSTLATSVTGEDGVTLLRSSVGYSVSKDTRDNRFDPSEGYSLKLDETLAGLGGDVKFLKTILSASYFKPFMYRSVVFGVSGKLGHITGLGGKKVTRSNRFLIGGRDVRGFTSAGIGPRDTGSDDAVGGNKMLAGRVEVLSSIGLDKTSGMRWSVFTDFGALWETDYSENVSGADTSAIRSSIGLGLFWSTPIGPLSFSLAKPISKSRIDKTESFQFSIGTRM
jgi:outer membrane protein insertion porin family